MANYSRVLELKTIYMEGSDVKDVQNKLRNLGFLTDTADGLYGPNTKTAVEKFQADAGISVTGKVNEAVWNRLFRNLYLQGTYMTGTDVRKMQARLNSLGYSVGTADGVFGPGTESAIISFQGYNGLARDGICGRNTWTKLFGSSALTKSSAQSILSKAKSINLLNGVSVSFTYFDVYSQPTIIGLSPYMTLKAKVSLTSEIGSGAIELPHTASGLESVVLAAKTKAAETGVEWGISNQKISDTIDKINYTIYATESIKHKVSVNSSGHFVVEVEYRKVIDSKTVYITMILTIVPGSSGPVARAQVPVADRSVSLSVPLISPGLAFIIALFALIFGALTKVRIASIAKEVVGYSYRA